MVKDKEEKTDIDQEQEIVQILGIRRKWLDVALKIYSVIFCAYSFSLMSRVSAFDEFCYKINTDSF